MTGGMYKQKSRLREIRFEIITHISKFLKEKLDATAEGKTHQRRNG